MQQKDKIDIPANKLHAGHRQRLAEKLNHTDLPAHEYLEALLFAVEPRRDTNETAHRLLFAFGSPYGVFNAPMESLLRIEGVGKKTAVFLRSVGGLVQSLYAEETSTFPASYTHETFRSFLKEEYKGVNEEIVDVYFLTGDADIFYRQRLAFGDIHSTQTTMRTLEEAIICEEPDAFILVHTHPHSNAKPSKEDIHTTENCQRVARSLGVMFVDHLIYSPQEIYSFYASKQLFDIAKAVKQRDSI